MWILAISINFCSKWVLRTDILFKVYFNHYHGAEFSVIWLVKWSAIKLLILIRYKGKTNFEVQRNFNANITLVALFKISFRSLFLDIEKKKTMQWSCSNTLRSFIAYFLKRDAFRLYCIGISWWLTSNRMAWFLVQLMMNLTHGNLTKFSLWKGLRKLWHPLVATRNY